MGFLLNIDSRQMSPPGMDRTTCSQQCRLVDPLLTKLTFLLMVWSANYVKISGNFRFLWSSPFLIYIFVKNGAILTI